jgi:hypothetical protein
MNRLAILFLFFSIPLFSIAQSNNGTQLPRLTKMPIGQSGCSAYFPKGMPEFELSKSEDGSDVYTSEAEVEGFYFACITVKFLEPFSDAAPQELENLLISYLDFLQSQFSVTEAAGAGKGNTLESSPNARGVIDYWQDAEDTHYVVKGWVNPRALGIMLIYGLTDYPHYNLQQMYLDGFRFPE